MIRWRYCFILWLWFVKMAFELRKSRWNAIRVRPSNVERCQVLPNCIASLKHVLKQVFFLFRVKPFMYNFVPFVQKEISPIRVGKIIFDRLIILVHKPPWHSGLERSDGDREVVSSIPIFYNIFWSRIQFFSVFAKNLRVVSTNQGHQNFYFLYLNWNLHLFYDIRI